MDDFLKPLVVSIKDIMGMACPSFLCIKLIIDLHLFFCVILHGNHKGLPVLAVWFLSKGSIHLSMWFLKFEAMIKNFLFAGGS
jgi:hypothetical protein